MRTTQENAKTAESDDEAETFEDIIIKLKQRFGNEVTLERFAVEHAYKFQGADINKEHKIEYQILHQKYLKLWESEVEQVLNYNCWSLRQLQEQMQDALDDRYTALFEVHEHHAWVDSALAALSFEHFLSSMLKKEAETFHQDEEKTSEQRTIIQRRGAEEKIHYDDDDDDNNYIEEKSEHK